MHIHYFLLKYFQCLLLSTYFIAKKRYFFLGVWIPVIIKGLFNEICTHTQFLVHYKHPFGTSCTSITHKNTPSDQKYNISLNIGLGFVAFANALCHATVTQVSGHGKLLYVTISEASLRQRALHPGGLME